MGAPPAGAGGHSLLFQMFFSHNLHMYTHTAYKMYRPRKFKYS